MLKQFAVSTENCENYFLNFRFSKIGLHHTQSSSIFGLSMQRFGAPALAGGVFYLSRIIGLSDSASPLFFRVNRRMRAIATTEARISIGAVKDSTASRLRSIKGWLPPAPVRAMKLNRKSRPNQPTTDRERFTIASPRQIYWSPDSPFCLCGNPSRHASAGSCSIP